MSNSILKSSIKYDTSINLLESYSKEEITKLINIMPELMNLSSEQLSSANNPDNLKQINLIKDTNKFPLIINKFKFFSLLLTKIKTYFQIKESVIMVKSLNLFIEEFQKICGRLRISEKSIKLSKSQKKRPKSNYATENLKKSCIKNSNCKGNVKKNVFFVSDTYQRINNKIQNKSSNEYHSMKTSHTVNNMSNKVKFSHSFIKNSNRCKSKEANGNYNNMTFVESDKNFTRQKTTKTKTVNNIFSHFDLKLFFDSNNNNTNTKKKLMSLPKNSKIKTKNKTPVNQLKNQLYNNSNNLYINIYEQNKKEITPVNIIKNNNNQQNTNDNNVSTASNIPFSCLDINNLLYNIETEDFDIFELDKKIGAENTLPLIGYYIYNRYGFCNIINYNKYENWCKKITQGYNRSNPYHTDLHAADITQSCLIYFKIGKVNEIIKLPNTSKCALFISCICHDYKHPGVNNNYLRDTKNNLAIEYNDNSILENMHISESFKLAINDESCDLFSEMDDVSYKKMRKEMITCVLNTDMFQHNKITNFMKTIDNKKDIDEDTQLKYMSLLIHSADISNPTKKFDIYFKWANLVVEEFYQQGDKEKLLGMKCSCDRNVITIYQNQLGFINFIELEFYELFVKTFPKLQFLLDNLNNNKNRLLKMQEEDKERKEAEKEKEKELEKEREKV